MELNNIREAIANLQSLKMEMHELTDKQKAKLDQIHIMEEKLAEVQGKMTRDEQNMKFEVSQETDSAGKKKFTNESMREHETIRRLDENTAYVAYKKEHKEYTRSMGQLKLKEQQLSKRKSGLMYEINAQRTVVDALVQLAKIESVQIDSEDIKDE